MLLSDTQSAIQRYDGYHVRTDLLLCSNHWRPHFEVKLSLSDRPRRQPISDSNALLAAQGLGKTLSITFPKALHTVIRTLILTHQAYESHDLEKREIDELPADTKAVIDRFKSQSSGCVPILLEVNYRSTDTLISDLTLQRPEWAKILGKHGLTAGRLTLLVDATSSTQRSLETFSRSLQDGRDPLFRFRMQRPNGDDDGARRESYDRKAFLKKLIASPHIQRLIGYQAADKFLTLREYCTIFGTGAVLDRVVELKKVADYEADLETLILVKCADDGLSGGFYGFIKPPSNKEFRLRVGDCLDVDIIRHQGPTWRAVVTSPVPVWRRSIVPLWVYPIRPKKDASRNRVRDSFEPDYIDPNGMSEGQLRHAVARDEGNSVEMKVVGIGDVLDNICRAYETLDDFKNVQSSENTAYAERVIEVLTSRRLDRLPYKDLYERIKERMTGTDTRKYMKKLNVAQNSAIESSRRLKAGIQIIQGPHGTGKTFLLQQMVVPFLVSERQSVVLVSTPTDHGADDLAHEIRQALYDLRDDPNLPRVRKRYILRLLAPVSENATMRTQGPKIPKEQVQNVKVPLLPRGTQRIMKGAAVQMLEQLRANDGTKFEGVCDKRVQDITYSAGYMMLLVSGVLPGTEYEGT